VVLGEPRRDHLLVARMVEPGSRVLDVGCGDGSLLALLRERRGSDARGIELSREGVSDCLAKGLAVIQGDADTDLANYPDDVFDYVILSQTLQATRHPRVVLEHMLRIGRRAIVSFPNFGHWRVRYELGVRGRMPVTENMPHSWYDTPKHPFLHDPRLRPSLPRARRPDRGGACLGRRRPARQVSHALVVLEPVWRAGRVPAEAELGRLTRHRVQVPDHVLQPVVEHVGVDLRGRDIGMAEQLLDDPQVGPVLEQVARESVAQDVRADLVRAQSRCGGEHFQLAAEGLAGEVSCLSVRWE
jgi:methionine biosynthesis protein MetW